ncbi:hypothetical protein MKW92_004560 [Papaver armeniacum]|nr:hypothetical protein MKW92_004560 [Papaver armeniacum]
MLEQDTVMSLQPVMLSIITILISCAIIYMLKKLIINRSADRSNIKLNLPPSPPKIPIFGNIHQLSPILHQCFHRMSTKYGPLMLLNLGEKRILVVSSAEMATQIVKTHDLTFADRLCTKAAKIMFFGGNNIALAPYGEQWRQLRKFCVLELLSTKRVQSFKCSLGDNFNKDYIERFLKLIKKATALIESFSFGDFIPWLIWMDTVTGLNRKLRKTSQELDTFFNQIIDDHHLDDAKEDKRNFIDLLVLHAEKDNLSLTRDAMKGIIMVIKFYPYIIGVYLVSLAGKAGVTELRKVCGHHFCCSDCCQEEFFTRLLAAA